MPDAREAAYRQVARVLEHRIRTGQPGYEPGWHLPSTAQLMRELRYGRDTIIDALKLLEHLGVVSRRQGYGAKVREPRQREVVTVPAGTVVTARMPTLDELDQWGLEPGVPMLVVGEQAYPADRYELAVGNDDGPD